MRTPRTMTESRGSIAKVSMRCILKHSVFAVGMPRDLCEKKRSALGLAFRARQLTVALSPPAILVVIVGRAEIEAVVRILLVYRKLAMPRLHELTQSFAFEKVWKSERHGCWACGQSPVSDRVLELYTLANEVASSRRPSCHPWVEAFTRLRPADPTAEPVWVHASRHRTAVQPFAWKRSGGA